jgi:hypothetical protein
LGGLKRKALEKIWEREDTNCEMESVEVCKREIRYTEDKRK